MIAMFCQMGLGNWFWWKEGENVEYVLHVCLKCQQVRITCGG